MRRSAFHTAAACAVYDSGDADVDAHAESSAGRDGKGFACCSAWVGKRTERGTQKKRGRRADCAFLVLCMQGSGVEAVVSWSWAWSLYCS